jgi:hypothetical protein
LEDPFEEITRAFTAIGISAVTRKTNKGEGDLLI